MCVTTRGSIWQGLWTQASLHGVCKVNLGLFPTVCLLQAFASIHLSAHGPQKGRNHGYGPVFPVRSIQKCPQGKSFKSQVLGSHRMSLACDFEMRLGDVFPGLLPCSHLWNEIISDSLSLPRWPCCAAPLLSLLAECLSVLLLGARGRGNRLSAGNGEHRH